MNITHPDLNRQGRVRLGFRARLTAFIAMLFALGGTLLLAVQYLLTRQLFTSAIDTFSVDCTEAGPDGVGIVTNEASTIVCGSAGTSVETGTVLPDAHSATAFVTQSTALSREVLSGLLLWSVLVLLIFTALAVLAAWWLTGRTLRRLTGITGAARSITANDLHARLSLDGPDDEIKELGDTLDSMFDRLETGFSKQQQFIANASHELRTPITSARTALEIPLTQGRVPADLEPSIRRALTATEHSEQTIAALLLLTQVSHFSNAPVTQASAGLPDVVLREALDRSLRAYQDLADRQGISLHRDPDLASSAQDMPGHAGTGAVSALLRIVVDNLVENAISHNQAEGTVWTRVVRDGERTSFIIENTGPELSGEELSACKEPFNRCTHSRMYATDDTRMARPGLGLGLPLALAAAERAGAQLTLTPRSGGGLIARLSFSET